MAKILSVEDDAEFQQVLGRALFREGYDVHYAWNGKEGYEKALLLAPDLLLLDIMLPVMNGLELLERLRSERATRELPVVIVTCLDRNDEAIKRAMDRLGAVCFVAKPVRLAELVGIVKRTLAQCPRQAGLSSATQSLQLRKGCLRADPASSTVWINDKPAATLSNKEFELLRCLLQAEEPLSKSALLRALAYRDGQDAALKQVVHRLRAALGPEGGRIKNTPRGYEILS
ncbi:MAG: response regulator transcription factor [Elusimicrobia bacterium]|nr:response regulator transcription factor [Elusimicrobiota bacterium]MDE2425588.1 response regulator transcription factor [Elusimicrobiota bacterium]